MKRVKNVIFGKKSKQQEIAKAVVEPVDISKKSNVQEEIDRCLGELKKQQPGTDEHDKLLRAVERLQTVRKVDFEEEHAKKNLRFEERKIDLEERKLESEEKVKTRVHPDTWAKGAMNVGYILVWVAVSHENVIPKMLNGLTR